MEESLKDSRSSWRMRLWKPPCSQNLSSSLAPRPRLSLFASVPETLSVGSSASTVLPTKLTLRTPSQPSLSCSSLPLYVSHEPEYHRAQSGAGLQTVGRTPAQVAQYCSSRVKPGSLWAPLGWRGLRDTGTRQLGEQRRDSRRWRDSLADRRSQPSSESLLRKAELACSRGEGVPCLEVQGWLRPPESWHGMISGTGPCRHKRLEANDVPSF